MFFWHTLIDSLFPDRCVGCFRPGSLLCPDCQVKIRNNPYPLCPGCLKPSPNGLVHLACQAPETPDSLFAPFRYQGVIERAVKLVKFRRDQKLGEVLASLLIEEVEEHRNFYHFLTNQKPLVVPIPLGRWRLRERGFNQAAILARRIARSWDLRLTPILERFQETRPQASLDRGHRQENVKGTFRVREDRLLREENILLVDDVVTTGATLKSATNTLRQAGTSSIWALVLAH